MLSKWNREMTKAEGVGSNILDKLKRTDSKAVLTRLSRCNSTLSLRSLLADFFFLDKEWDTNEAIYLKNLMKE